MITVHHLNNSRSQRILWLLEELALPYEIKRYERNRQTNLAPPDLRAVHPLGKSPVITDGDLTIAETGAIVEYLLETYGAGRMVPPAGSPDRLRYRYWLHAAEGSVMPPLVMKLVVSRVPRAKMPFFAKPIARGIAERIQTGFTDPNIARLVAHMDAALAETGWFAGPDITGADVMMSFPAEAAVARGGGGSAANVVAFVARIHARPTWQQALAKGGPYELLR
jgi:glutathione S-transferase